MNHDSERPYRKKNRKLNIRPETGTVWLSGLIVTVAASGVALLTTSIMPAIYLSAFLTAALTVVLTLLRS